MALDIDTYLKFSRLSGLLVAPDGRLVVQSARPDPAGTAFVTEVVGLDPAGGGAPRPLAGPRSGLAAAGFEPDGSLLLVDKRPDPAAAPSEGAADDETAALWRLPVGGGEARYVTGTPAGVSAVRVARDAGTTVVISGVFPSEDTLAEDGDKAKARKKAGTSALLFEGYPFRFWDTPLAPRAPRLFVVEADGSLRDLTGNVGNAIDPEASFDITPDGRTVLMTWTVPTGQAESDRTLVAIDVETGERRTLLHDPAIAEGTVVCSPDGRYAALTRMKLHTTERPWDDQLWLVSLADGAVRQVAAGFEHFPEGPVWTPDSRSLLFAADEAGRKPLWRVDIDIDGAAPVRLSADGAFTDIRVAPDGSAVYALRSSWARPPEVVALDPHLADQQPTVRYAGDAPEALPGKMEEVHTTAEDGTALRAWLITPAQGEGPFPLLVVVHGGPVHSWNMWSWRWQPQLFAARGYAVLLPDPALSTGYGRHMLERGWQEWGGRPYTDVLALTDAALERPDLDAERTAVAGGSYGGYLTNWIIGHTDRFRCAISHASLWDLSSFRPATDDLVGWERWYGDPRKDPEFYRKWSPSTYVDDITTPTLVIHGERDYRCPVGEGLALYSELQRRDVSSAMLYLPDEGHWVLKPGNVKLWYQSAFAWLDHHVLDQPWERPELA
ncbi:MAG: prolyl oligopeptidase family protein [Amycolatopsis sp.]|uniref:S9 family peptidase n=1 Tax=Amycolatopsis sp. TaxID=37632 RepID=UPI002607F52D|nr:S9 family peptidase [Amycolatopsis sp.]MCU1687070.1 prolyl oligopeptidase family protein [Amycolatopsis sp.]